MPLAVSPVPAIKVLRVGSVGSKERLEIESDACLSVSGVQVVPPLVVFQMPPAGVPANNVLHPGDRPPPAQPRRQRFHSGAHRRSGPCTWARTGNRALRDKILVDLELRSRRAVGSATTVAMTNPRNGPNMTRPHLGRNSIQLPGCNVPEE